MFSWFNKKAAVVKSDAVLLKEQMAAISSERIGPGDIYKTINIRAIMVAYQDGGFSPKMAIPDKLLSIIQHKTSNRAVLVEKEWYNHQTIYNSTVDVTSIDYTEMEELWVPDVVETFKRAMHRAYINSHDELVIMGSPVLINTLLPFIDVLEIYVNKLEPIGSVLHAPFSKHVIGKTATDGVFSLGSSKLICTKSFELPSYLYYNLVNMNPQEIKNA